jgi:hypothetical protein
LSVSTVDEDILPRPVLGGFSPRPLGAEHLHGLLDGLAAHGTQRRSHLGQLLRTQPAHAHVTARHDDMVLGCVESHHTQCLLCVRLRRAAPELHLQLLHLQHQCRQPLSLRSCRHLCRRLGRRCRRRRLCRPAPITTVSHSSSSISSSQSHRSSSQSPHSLRPNPAEGEWLASHSCEAALSQGHPHIARCRTTTCQQLPTPQRGAPLNPFRRAGSAHVTRGLHG